MFGDNVKHEFFNTISRVRELAKSRQVSNSSVGLAVIFRIAAQYYLDLDGDGSRRKLRTKWEIKRIRFVVRVGTNDCFIYLPLVSGVQVPLA